MNPLDVNGVHSIKIETSTGNYVIRKDTRHGVGGFRMTHGIYQFYKSWEDVLAAIADPNLRLAGQRAFQSAGIY